MSANILSDATVASICGTYKVTLTYGTKLHPILSNAVFTICIAVTVPATTIVVAISLAVIVAARTHEAQLC